MVCHGVGVAGATRSAPPATRICEVASEILDLEGDPEVAGDPPPDLDPIDERRLRRIGDLERRPARLEDDHPTIR